MNRFVLIFKTTFILCLLSFLAQSQFQGIPVQLKNHDIVETIRDFELYEFPVEQINKFVQIQQQEHTSFLLQIQFGLTDWQLELESSQLLSSNYQLTKLTPNGREISFPKHNIAFKGIDISSGEKCRMTISKGLINGYVKSGKDLMFIEPFQNINPTAPSNQYIIYKASKVNEAGHHTCAVTEMHDHAEDLIGGEKAGECLVTDLAIFSDFSMYTAYGNGNDASLVEAENIAVMNNVSGNYDDEFADEIQFLVVTQVVSTCSTCDEISASTDSGTLLNSFGEWANAGGFGGGVVYDLGQLWSDRNFDGTTIGLAWVGAVCSPQRYHVLERFSNNANSLRVLTAHEIGHNFSAGHDDEGSAFIMAPSVQNTVTWSDASINSISNFAASGNANCMASCFTAAPPTAEFLANIPAGTSLCPGSEIQFIDDSGNGATAWQWSFPGATPATSSEQNPTVIYENPGLYTVTLVASNQYGDNTMTKTDFVNVDFNGRETFFFEDFEGPFDWITDNPDNGITWTIFNIGAANGSRAPGVENYQYNSAGQRDGLTTPSIDFSGRENIMLDFEHAHKRYSQQYADSLVVYVSTNDGAIFSRIFGEAENGSGNFATGFSTTNSFFPESSEEWCYGSTTGPDCFSIDLSAYAGETNVKIKFENVTDYGNNTFFDNVAVSSTCAQVALPISLLDFSGQQEGNHNLLSWQTERELNNAYFWIERSNDGINFEKIGQMQGAGNSNNKLTYSFKDNNPFIGNNYYKLSQMDFDGKETVSRTISVAFKKAGTVTISPNPVTGEMLNIFYNSTKKGEIQLEIFELSGKLVSQIKKHAQRETNHYTYNTNNHPSGIYILKITDEQNTFVTRFIKE